MRRRFSYQINQLGIGTVEDESRCGFRQPTATANPKCLKIAAQSMG
jgi:hypothetical protein